MRAIRLLLFALLIALLSPPRPAVAQPAEPVSKWYEVDAKKNVRINVYVFWSRGCPRCAGALEFINDLQQRRSWANVHSYEITGNAANRELYGQMAASLGRSPGQTPAIFYCKYMHIGYVSYNQTGWYIERDMLRWYESLQKQYREGASAAAGVTSVALVFDAAEPPPDLPIEPPPAEEHETVSVPGLGEIEPDSLSLPTLTLVLAGCDSVNPCAFFVLLLLLSLLVHTHSRGGMLLVGGTFVFFSGLMYFVFMAAWLNLFMLIGHLQQITIVAGLVAIAVAAVNVKDFFWLHRGPSLTIPQAAKPGLYQRMTGLMAASRWPSLLAGTVALAFTANLYELLCTSGFPMVFTRVLTLHELPTAVYYLYLLAYNLIYVLPLTLIVLGFVWTLGTRKLTEYEGRLLKLLSGLMMLSLGLLLVFRPETLHSVAGSVAVLVGAVGLTAALALGERWRARSRSRSGAHQSPTTIALP